MQAKGNIIIKHNKNKQTQLIVKSCRCKLELQQQQKN